MRYLIPAVLVAAMLPVAAAAQTAPELKGPFYEIGSGPTGTTVIAMGTRQRYGDRADITRIVLLHKANKVGEMLVWRVDGLSQYDCTAKTTRALVLAARDDKGAVLKLYTPQGDFKPLGSGDGTAAVSLTAACDGAVPAGAKRFDDFEAWQRQFRVRYPAQ